MSTGVTSNTEMHAGSHPVIQSAVIMRETLRLPTMMNMLARNATNMVTTTPDTRTETDKSAPVVIVNDLTKSAGTEVTIRLNHDISGKPIMGTREAQGRGSLRTSSTDSIKINRYTKSVKDGDVYSWAERGYNLKDFNKSDLGKYYRQLDDQLLIYHLAGARGHHLAKDTHVPLDDDIDFNSIMINPLNPPSAYAGGDGTSSRHFFAGEKDSIGGGSKPLTAADKLTLGDFRHWKVLVEEMPSPPEPVDLSPDDDPYRYDPMYVCCISPRGWEDLSADTDTKEFEKLRAAAIERAKIIAGEKGVHPIFRGDCLLIDSVLIRKMPYPVRFSPGMPIKMADPTRKRLTIVEQMIPVNASYCVERGLWIGGQALALAFGNAMAGVKASSGENMQSRNFRLLEAPYDFGRKSETGIDWVKGMKKITFTDADGIDIDRGVIAFDYATRLK